MKIEVFKDGVITKHELCFRYTMPPYEIAPPYYYGSIKDSCTCGDDDCERKRDDDDYQSNGSSALTPPVSPSFAILRSIFRLPASTDSAPRTLLQFRPQTGQGFFCFPAEP